METWNRLTAASGQWGEGNGGKKGKGESETYDGMGMDNGVDCGSGGRAGQRRAKGGKLGQL